MNALVICLAAAGASGLTLFSGFGLGTLLATATGSAFLGAWIGSLLVPKVTMRTIQILVAILLFLIAAGLALGLI